MSRIACSISGTRLFFPSFIKLNCCNKTTLILNYFATHEINHVYCNTMQLFNLVNSLSKAKVIVSWNGWQDDLAGIHHYEYDVFELTSDGTQLTQGLSTVAEGKNISATQEQASTYLFLHLII